MYSITGNKTAKKFFPSLFYCFQNYFNILKSGVHQLFGQVDILDSLEFDKALVLCPDDEMGDFIIKNEVIVLGKDDDTVRAVVFPTKMPSMILAMLNSIIKVL